MLVDKLARFIRKPAEQKRVTARYFARKALGSLPYAPVPTKLPVAPGENVRFWWSYVPMSENPDRPFLNYPGNDCGELRFLWKFLRPGMVFFDIGAFHGIFSLLAGKKLSSGGQIVAFEPSKRERRRFELHMRLNGVRGVRLEPYAVAEKIDTRNFFTVVSGFTSMNSLRKPHIDTPLRETSVDTVSLDGYLANRRIAQIDLVKMDVEGGELEAFRGANRMLETIRPVLICEVLDWVTRPWGYPAREIVQTLGGQDYDWFDFREDGTISPHRRRDEYPEIQNYLAVPREKLQLVERWRRA